jgi:hypothetical protein
LKNDLLSPRHTLGDRLAGQREDWRAAYTIHSR